MKAYLIVKMIYPIRTPASDKHWVPTKKHNYIFNFKKENEWKQ
jgi:hypothetical protein